MDHYGFYANNCPYPYNQTDELAKQMYAQQAFASSVPFTPVPNNNMAGGSWNSRGITWGMQSPPHLVQFTGQAPYNDNNLGPVLHSKRKSLDMEPAIPAKQLITEEKMAAHLNGLHISSDFTPHSNTENMDVMMDTRDEGLGEKVKGTIVLAEEVKRIRDEPLLPAVLIERYEKPNMSLVVWKPRNAILKTIKEKDPKIEEEEPVKRNGVLVDNININNNNQEDIDM